MYFTTKLTKNTKSSKQECFPFVFFVSFVVKYILYTSNSTQYL
jgi:hypothetical protein